MTGSSTKQAGAPGVRSGTQLSSQGGTTMTDETISATTIINAPAEAIFAVLADPAKHAAIDGTGWVREPLDGQPLTAAGQVFRMAIEGPVFLTARKPGRAVASGDLCPVTRRARLSYRWAAESFELATRPLANPGACHEELEEVHGWTLHQLRHSLLTHEAEDGTSTPMLLARSRHASVRSLERYARPGPEAVARHVAAADPAARRRRP